MTLIGNLTDDPELRTVDADTVVAHFTVASTPRLFDRKTHEWRDGETLFLRCSLWRQAAENVAASLKKGARVIVTGRLQQRSFTTSDGGTNLTAHLLRTRRSAVCPAQRSCHPFVWRAYLDSTYAASPWLRQRFPPSARVRADGPTQ